MILKSRQNGEVRMQVKLEEKRLYGFAGRILRVNLTTGKIWKEKMDEATRRSYVGGRGFAAKVLFEELEPGIDPLGPENKLVVAVGPTTGARFPGNARYGIFAKSPLTGIWGEGHAAGYFGPELKFAGFDAIIIEGASKDPVYLFVRDGEAEIRDASRLWGKVTGEVQEAIRKEVEDMKTKVAAIGPGGENLVRFACVISDLKNAVGRCGMGAVMGSKKLKAIAVRGTGIVNIADKNRFVELARKAVKESWEGWGKNLRANGTGRVLDDLDGTGRLPTKHFQRCTFEGTEKITGETMSKEILVKAWPCFGCSVGCKRIVQAKEPYEVDPAYGGPEYETLASFGSTLLNDNLVSIAKANELCNKYTLDTISTGMVIGFAMECYERGLLTKEDTDGLDLKWGNYPVVIKLIEKIAYRDGFGNLLAEGELGAAKKIGKGAEKFAMVVKGMEMPMHEPRGKKGVGLSYATSNRGACHLQVPHDDTYENNLAPEIGLDERFPAEKRYRTYYGPEKAKIVKIGQDLWAAYDTFEICKFTPYPAGISITTLTNLISSVVGYEVTPTELTLIGERAFNLCRAFNVREGIRRKDDRLPERMMEPMPDGLLKGEGFTKEGWEKYLDAYYEYRGWSKETGIPKEETLNRLGLDFAASELKRLGIPME